MIESTVQNDNDSFQNPQNTYTLRTFACSQSWLTRDNMISTPDLARKCAARNHEDYV